MSDDNVIQFRPKTTIEIDQEVFTISLTENCQIYMTFMQDEAATHDDFDWIQANLDIVKQMVENARMEILGSARPNPVPASISSTDETD